MNALNIDKNSPKNLEICIDKELKIITAPCYMMQASVNEVYKKIELGETIIMNFSKLWKYDDKYSACNRPLAPENFPDRKFDWFWTFFVWKVCPYLLKIYS